MHIKFPSKDSAKQGYEHGKKGIVKPIGEHDVPDEKYHEAWDLGDYHRRQEEAKSRKSPLAKDATANLMKEERLTKAADQKHELAAAAARDEAKLPKTAESLGILGAGKEYGE